MNTLKHLNLSEKDFSLIIDGLDYLPEKSAMGGFMGDLLGTMFMKDDPDAKRKMEIDRKLRMEKEKHDKDMMKEDIKILQGKLLMLKRYLMETGALNDTMDILNHIS
jgi:hypothetical protein